MTACDYEWIARQLLEPAAFDYFAGGALDERALENNTASFRGRRLYHRVLRAAVQPDLGCSLLGQQLAMPVLIAPVAFQQIVNPEGEVATARAAAAAGTTIILSTTSNMAVEAVAAASNGSIWMQLYMMKDRGFTTALVRRAESAGCRAITLTVDVPAWGRRERDIRNRFSPPRNLVIQTLMIPGYEKFYSGVVDGDLSTFLNERLKYDLTWSDVDWLRSITKLPVILKGVSHPEDARQAVRLGAAGIIISNHGGRQLDAAPATLDVLPAAAEAVDGTIPIILDGGVRRGTDVVTALALGASAVSIGRPVLWGLAARGEAGVSDVLATLRAEIANTLTLCGCSSLSEITPDLVWREASSSQLRSTRANGRHR